MEHEKDITANHFWNTMHNHEKPSKKATGFVEDSKASKQQHYEKEFEYWGGAVKLKRLTLHLQSRFQLHESSK